VKKSTESLYKNFNLS